MIIKRHLICLTAALISTAAMAHQGVKNPAVMARMEGMSAIAKHLKVIGEMAQGKTAFDATAAKAAAAGIAQHAEASVDLFRAEETDPKSEAKPEIWENFSDFEAQSYELAAIARALSVSISDPDDLKPALASLGQTCKSCHSDYRE